MTGYPCGCGETHTSASQVMYCEDAIRADDRAARRPHARGHAADMGRHVQLGYD